jgi:hypothetical protein
MQIERVTLFLLCYFVALSKIIVALQLAKVPIPYRGREAKEKGQNFYIDRLSYI